MMLLIQQQKSTSLNFILYKDKYVYSYGVSTRAIPLFRARKFQPHVPLCTKK